MEIVNRFQLLQYVLLSLNDHTHHAVQSGSYITLYVHTRGVI